MNLLRLFLLLQGMLLQVFGYFRCNYSFPNTSSPSQAERRDHESLIKTYLMAGATCILYDGPRIIPLMASAKWPQLSLELECIRRLWRSWNLRIFLFIFEVRSELMGF